MKILGIIPARYASSRFPGKLLADLAGKSVLQRVYERAKSAAVFDKLLIATDDKRIFDHVTSFFGEAVMTSVDHQSGTDRCAEASRLFKGFDVVVNLQGDEPFIAASQLREVIQPFMENTKVNISTLAKQIQSAETLFNPNVVKVVFGKKNEALYFSRHPIPFVRGFEKQKWLEKSVFYKHIGLYAFRAQILEELSKLETGEIEQAESLEQLRWLEAGYSIHVGISKLETIGIDTPEDLENAINYYYSQA